MNKNETRKIKSPIENKTHYVINSQKSLRNFPIII